MRLQPPLRHRPATLGSVLGMPKCKLIFWLAIGQAIMVVAYTWGLKAITQ